jgi:hypothetical protein
LLYRSALKGTETNMLANRVVEMKATLRDSEQACAAVPRIAILIPCKNEALTVADVVCQFRDQLPTADVYVFDNNSSDGTVEQARNAGAMIFHERRQGKGYVVQSMFQQRTSPRASGPPRFPSAAKKAVSSKRTSTTGASRVRNAISGVR